MTDYTMRLPVWAWQVQPDGKPPEDMPWELTWRLPHFHSGPGYKPGDWAIEAPDPFGLVAMSDAEFRARCEEVKADGSV